MPPENGASARILAGTRTRAEVMKLAGPGTRQFNLQGQTLMPGFIDAHGHFPGSGQKVIAADLGSPPVGTVTTMAELLAASQAVVDAVKGLLA